MKSESQLPVIQALCGARRKLQRHSDQLLLDALAVLSGAKPAFLLDYAQVAAEDLEPLAVDLQRATGVDCALLSWGTSCHLVANVRALICHLQREGLWGGQPGGVSLEAGGATTRREMDDEATIAPPVMMIGFDPRVQAEENRARSDVSDVCASPRILKKSSLWQFVAV